MARKNALRDRLVKVLTSAALGVVEADPVELDKIYCYQRVTWEIDKRPKNGNARVRMYIAGHGYNHDLREWAPVVANRLYGYPWPVWLIPGERLALEVDQAQATTTVRVYITGYWTDQAEGMA